MRFWDIYMYFLKFLIDFTGFLHENWSNIVNKIKKSKYDLYTPYTFNDRIDKSLNLGRTFIYTHRPAFLTNFLEIWNSAFERASSYVLFLEFLDIFKYCSCNRMHDYYWIWDLPWSAFLATTSLLHTIPEKHHFHGTHGSPWNLPRIPLNRFRWHFEHFWFR